MFSLLSEFTRDVDSPSTIIVMDAEGLEQPRRYQVVPRHLLYLATASLLGFGMLLVTLVAFTPLRELIPGYGTSEMRQNARLNVLRISALEDSLLAQDRYMTQLRQIMLGQIDSTFLTGTREPPQGLTAEGIGQPPPREPSANWSDHQQPAIAIDRLAATAYPAYRLSANAARPRLPSMVLPALPPVDGLVTRGFDARTGHYAIDIAVEVGTMVRSIGDGYVIFADWTHEGGHAIAIQHADGYVTVYKHNERLLKRVGDRVRPREAVAMSGNSGEITTGPHLHFEIWQNGLAQDPRNYILTP